MKKFIIRFIVFLIPVALFIGVSIGFYNAKRHTVIKKASKIADNSTIIMGDSQMQRLKPKLFKNTYNFAGSGEHYYFTYNKLMTLLKSRDNKIKKVILNCGPHNFSPAYSRKIKFSGNIGKADLKRYFYFISSYDKNVLQIKDIISFRIIADVYSHPDWGGTYSSNADNPDSTIINAIYRKHFNRKSSEPEFAESQMIYLKKIIDLCSKNSIELVLVSMPYHPDYSAKISPEFLKHYNDIIENLPHVKYINLIDVMPDPAFMSDATHLNDKGVERVVREHLQLLID